jgi:hypothetical protein
VVEERRQNKGREGNPRVNIGRHDKLRAKSMFFPFKFPRTCFHKSNFLLLLSRTLPCFVLFAKSSGTIKNLPSRRTSTLQGRLPLDILHAPAPHLEENHLRQISHYCNLSPIYTPRCNILLPSSLPCHAISFSPPLMQYILPSPIYPLFTHFFSEYRYTPSSPLHPNPLQKRHNSPHNPQQPHTHLHTPRSVLPRGTRRVARPRAGGTRRSAPRRRARARLRPTRTCRRHRALSARNYCNRGRSTRGSRRGSSSRGHGIGRDDRELVRVVDDGVVLVVDDLEGVAGAGYEGGGGCPEVGAGVLD